MMLLYSSMSVEKFSISLPSDISEWVKSKVKDHTFGSVSHAVTLGLIALKEKRS